jgi:hypothetical protein
MARANVVGGLDDVHGRGGCGERHVAAEAENLVDAEERSLRERHARGAVGRDADEHLAPRE